MSTAPTTNSASAPWWWEEDLDLKPSAAVTQLTVTITVARTSAGITNAGYYNTTGSAALQTTETTSGTTLVYRTVLAAGQSLAANGTTRVATQFSGNGVAHATSRDTYSIVATVGGNKINQSGHF